VGAAGIHASGLLRDTQVGVSQVFKFASANILICAGLLFAVPRWKADRHA
jgi:hypothetical protein